MVCTARARSELYQIDPKWMVKFRIRILQSIVCGLSIGAVAFTLGHRSNFQSTEFKDTGVVWYYLPAVILTIIWNTINIIWLSKTRRPLSTLVNTIVHFVLCIAFAVLGCICTLAIQAAYRNITDDPYDIQGTGSHDTIAANGTMITVTRDNVSSCPAFPNCKAQKGWIDIAQRRSAFALGGCVLVDIAFFLHVVLFIWNLINTALSANRRQSPSDSEELEKYDRSNKGFTVRRKVMTELEITSAGGVTWWNSEAALLETKPTFAHDDDSSRPSLSLSVLYPQQTEAVLQSYSPPQAVSPMSRNHSKHFPITPPLEYGPTTFHSQIQRMDFPDPVKTTPSLCTNEYDSKYSPLSHPVYPYSAQRSSSSPLSGSLFGDPGIPLPDRSAFYRQITQSQKSLALSSNMSLSDTPRSGSLSTTRPKTADLGAPELNLTALPVPPPGPYTFEPRKAPRRTSNLGF